MRTSRLARSLALAATLSAIATDLSSQVAARSYEFDSVRATIRRAIDNGVPSIAVAVAKDGRIIWEEGFGMADRERQVLAGPQTMYSLASISKPFTATGLMKLVERGKVQLDRPANEYLGGGRLTGLAGDAAQATVRRVMSHTAGLPLHYQFFYENAAYRRPSMDTTISRYGILVNPPGEVYQYSNLGFGIIDHIIGRVSGQSYADYMRSEVFLPLGLTHTSVDIGPGLEAYVAQRYDAKLRPIPFYTFDHPGGSAVYSSAHDLVRFGMFHLKNHLADQRRILADSTIEAMQRIYTPDSTNGGYGLGWLISRDENGYRRVSHTGGMPGVNTVLALYPSENLAVVVLANQVGATPFRVADDIVAAILPRYAAERTARRARQAAAAPTAPPAFPPAELAGAWTGTLRAYDGTTPISLLFQPDGDVHVTLGNQLNTLLSNPSFSNGELSGRFLGTIPTEEQRRYASSVLLDVRLRDGALRGQASAMSTDDPVYYALTSYVELRRVTDRPLSSDDAARYTGTYTTASGSTVRVTTEGGKLKVEGGGRVRLFLYQGENTFVASDDPGVRVVFRAGGDGKAATVALTLGGQTTEARRLDSALVGPPLTTAPVRVDTAPRGRLPARRDTVVSGSFRDRNAMDADIARGPVPGYAGLMSEGGCTFVVFLTDTVTQKAAAEVYFRSEMESRRPGCGLHRFSFRQVRYDFAQLYDWYVGPFRAVYRERGLAMTDIDEVRNQLVAGVEDSATYRRMVRAVAALPIPGRAVHVAVSGRTCVGTGGPSVLVEVRDPQGRPAAIGTTIVIQDGTFRDSVDGAHPVNDLRVGAGERRPGRYEVRLRKPGYRLVVLRDVMAPGDEQCRYAEPTDVRKVRLEPLPNAPKVRSVVVFPPGMAFGVPDDSLQLRAVLDADPGVSRAIRWTSSDTTVATISATGVLRTKCRATTGEAVITATSVADSQVRGQASVAVWRPEVRGLNPERAARNARECLDRLRLTPRDSSR